MLNARYKNSTGHALVVSKKKKKIPSIILHNVSSTEGKVHRSISTIDTIALQSVLFYGTKQHGVAASTGYEMRSVYYMLVMASIFLRLVISVQVAT